MKYFDQEVYADIGDSISDADFVKMLKDSNVKVIEVDDLEAYLRQRFNELLKRQLSPNWVGYKGYIDEE